jgi:hypothetical protein
MDLFLRNKSKLDNCRFGLFEIIKESAVSMTQLAKKPTVTKTIFLKFSKKLGTRVLHRNPILDLFSAVLGDCVYSQVIISKYL